MEKEEHKTTLANVTLLFLSLAREQMDEMNAEHVTIEQDVIHREDGRKYRITAKIEAL